MQCFLSSGEDGQVLLFDMRTSNGAARRGSENGTASTANDRAGPYAPVQRMRVFEWGSRRVVSVPRWRRLRVWRLRAPRPALSRI